MCRNKIALVLSTLFLLWALAAPFSVAEELDAVAQAEAAREIEASVFEEIEASEADDGFDIPASEDGETILSYTDEASVPDGEAEIPDEGVACLPVDEPQEAGEFDLPEDEDPNLTGDSDIPSDVDFTCSAEPEEQVAAPTLGLDGDEAISGYIHQQLYAGTPSGRMPLMAAGGTAGSRLAEGTPERRLYDRLRPLIQSVASGQLASTAFTMPINEIYDDVAYSAADLGVDALLDGGSIAAQAQSAFNQRVALNLSKVLNALMVDMPYDLYWYDKTRGTTYYSLPIVYREGVLRLKNYDTGVLTYNFRVAAEYSASGEVNTYEMDDGKAGAIRAAADNARQIVDRYSACGDLDKLRAYKDAICDLASYNYDAAKGGANYGNPWQLVWVFDGIEETKVVCEGYAKAFQYLCELSTFEGDVSVVSAFGKMYNEKDGGGEHMWNVVTFDGENYLADITNCDSGTVGYPDKLFMIGYTDRAEANNLAGVVYYFETGTRTLRYYYDDKFVNLFGIEDVSISARATGPEGMAPYSGETGELKWALNSAGTLYIEGSGAMPDYTAESPAPWCADEIRENVKKVYLREGVTGIGDRAFYGCANMIQLSLPDGTVRFGEALFTDTRMGEEGAKVVIRSCVNARAEAYMLDLQEAGAINGVTVNHGSSVLDPAVAPTCTRTGLTEGYHCALCGDVSVAQQVVPATGHKAVSVAAVAATTTSEGLTEGSKCAVCNAVLVAQQVVPRLAAQSDKTEGTTSDAQTDETAATAPTSVEVTPDYTFHLAKNATKSVEKGTPIQIVVDGKKVKSYKSSNKKVATVSKKGWVTTRKAGTAKITVTLKNKKKLTLKVKVVDPYLAKSIKLVQGKTATVRVGQKLELSTALSPVTAVSALKWKSGNKKIATVNQKGVVTAKKAGKVKITVTTANKKKAVITVRVVK